MSTRVRLVLASTLMLFLELSLIRWSGANVLHLSYFSNFVLLGSFLGIGLGFLRAGRARRGRRSTRRSRCWPRRLPVGVPGRGRSRARVVIFFTSLSTTGPPIWLTLPVIFLAVAAIMAGPGELVADASPSCRGWRPTATT